jgi:TrkA domain protein
MRSIQETKLPGVGVRHDFVTRSGDRLGVIAHKTGRRELLVYDDADPDACQSVVRLEEEDSHALAELLGGSGVAETQSSLMQSVEGLTLDWLPIEAGSRCVGAPLRDAGIRSETGVSIVAIVREGRTIPAPGPDFVLAVDDTAVVVGTPEGIQETFALLQGG